MRSRSTLDWSQSKIFLVLTLIIFSRLMLMAKTTKLCKAHLFFYLTSFMSMHYHVKHRCSKLLHNAELLSQVNAVTS